MALPKRRLSTYRKGKRRAGHLFKTPQVEKCKQCNTVKRTHTICHSCGYYGDKKIIDIKTKKKTQG